MKPIHKPRDETHSETSLNIVSSKVYVSPEACPRASFINLMSCERSPPPTLYRNVQRFRGGLVVKAPRGYVSLNSRLESNEEEAVPAHAAEREGNN